MGIVILTLQSCCKVTIKFLFSNTFFLRLFPDGKPKVSCVHLKYNKSYNKTKQINICIVVMTPGGAGQQFGSYMLF